MAVELYIPHWQPAPINQIIGGRHWAKGHRLKKQDKKMVWAYAQGHPKATGKRRVEVTIILQKGKRAFDPDSQLKSMLDALVACGMLADDNRQNVEIAPVQYERGTLTDWGTRIVLTDL